MEPKRFDTLIDALQDFRENGYKSQFVFKDKMLCCSSTKKNYSANDLKIIEHHRFEGESNPSDASVVFAVECNDGTKGVVVSSYGVYGDTELLQFMDTVKFKSGEQVNPSALRS